MEFELQQVCKNDGRAIIDIFNYYVVHTFAAYPEAPVPYESFAMFQNMAEGYSFLVVKDRGGNVLGFGFLHPHSPMSAFSRTALITYFLAPEHTGKGIGKALLERLLSKARHKGITAVLASISSLNPGSIAFHQKNGFVPCGRFVRVGQKKGQDFDEVWMQRML
jgi:L-amino acid N-acyltransferase YncA